MKLIETTIRSFLTKETVMLKAQDDLIYLYLNVYQGENHKRANAISFKHFELENYSVNQISDEKILK